MGAADSLQGQARSSSQQERSDSSKVRRIMGLETWTAEQEPGADDEEEQPGAEEMALERKKQFEAVCPLLLETGEVLAAPTLEDLTPPMLVYATKSGAVLDPQAVAAGRRKQLQALKEQKATRKQRRLLRGYSRAEGAALGGQHGIERKADRVLRRGGSRRARTD